MQIGSLHRFSFIARELPIGNAITTLPDAKGR